MSDFYSSIQKISAPQALGVFFGASLGLFYALPLIQEATTKGKVLSALVGLAAAGLLHFLRKFFNETVLPLTHSQVAFHFSWISACAGMMGFFSPALGIQIALLGAIVATVGFIYYPIVQVIKKQYVGFILLLVFALFASDFVYQFFILPENAWKITVWRFPLSLAGFTSVLFVIFNRFSLRTPT